MEEKGLEKTGENAWHPQFKYQSVEIPYRNLPVHPNLEASSLRNFPNSSIPKTVNPALKMIIEKKKKDA